MTSKHVVTRYTGVAIALHWLIALIIISLLAAGKFMTSLDEADPLRFVLTQWHKSFGIAILLLSVFRIIWRLSHKPPALPKAIRGWQKKVSAITHFLLYFLMLAMPVSGWIMVSTSPLNLSTVLFNVIPFPHLPVLASLANKAEISHLFHEIHHISSGVMIALLLMHIGAALMHQFVHRDSVMLRVAPQWGSQQTKDGLGLLVGGISAAVLVIVLLGATQKLGNSPAAANTSSGENPGTSETINSDVTFKLVLMGGDVDGSFAQSTVQIILNTENPDASTLSATVKTASAKTTDPQINNSLPGPDWFDSERHPDALFVSTAMQPNDELSWQVTGDLTLRETTRPVTFTLEIDQATATAQGAFTINRLDYAIGAIEQPDDSIAGLNVLIDFNFPLSPLAAE